MVRIVSPKRLSYVTVKKRGERGEASINYGLFIQSVVDFLIISACIFLFIKMLSQLKRKEEEKPAPPPAPSPEIALLTEIRDLLKERS